jgi:hypothetical protein
MGLDVNRLLAEDLKVALLLSKLRGARVRQEREAPGFLSKLYGLLWKESKAHHSLLFRIEAAVLPLDKDTAILLDADLASSIIPILNAIGDLPLIFYNLALWGWAG